MVKNYRISYTIKKAVRVNKCEPDRLLRTLHRTVFQVLESHCFPGESSGEGMISTVALFWALFLVCVINMARYFSSLRALLVVLRGCDPLLYQYVDGGGFLPRMASPASRSALCGISTGNVISIIMTTNLFAAANACAASLF